MKPDFLTSSFLALRHKLHLSALSFLHNDEDARDALQDTYIRLLEKGPVSTDTEARNKLFAVLHNVCIDRLRRAATLRTEPVDETSATVEQPFGEDPARLQELITQGLSDIQRHIVALVANEQMEYDAIARRLGMTEGAVRTALSRARMKMRENYNKLQR